jgi:hypothetical protein
MATNDTKVHTTDVQVPPISCGSENRKATESPFLKRGERFHKNLPTAEGNDSVHFPLLGEEPRAGETGCRPPRAPDLFSAAFDLQIILHRKYVRHAVGSKIREVLISVAVNHSFQRDVSVFHDDMNGGHSRKSVAR